MTSLAKINISPVPGLRVLVAPLDWGLGHATRCIPIINELISRKCEIWIAASGDQKALLKEEFPTIPFVELPGYKVRYGKNRALTLLKVFGAIPKILIRIKREQAWLRHFLAAEPMDLVISDNRYGLHAPGLYSVFITHQLQIRTPFGSWADTLVRKAHYRAFRRFSICWVPDLEGSGSLAGTLSHPGKLPPIPLRYIGLLSRMTLKGKIARQATGQLAENFTGTIEEDQDAGDAACDLLVLLSGPEPQRTIFEKKVWRQLAGYAGRVVLVRGMPGQEQASGGQEQAAVGQDRGPVGSVRTARVRVYNHLSAASMSRMLQGAGIVLCRAGYSTIMDLMKLGKRAILVPTPGQTEQEYLGSFLSQKGIALCREQSVFSLAEALAAAAVFPFDGPEGGMQGNAGGGLADPARVPDAAKNDYAGDQLLQEAVDSLLKTVAGRRV